MSSNLFELQLAGGCTNPLNAWMQVAMGSIDVLDVASDPVLDEAKTRALWFSGIGMGGPALVAGSLLLMYEVALALFIGFGPIFILMLLFDATKQMFWKWLWLGIGTIFSMSILAVMVSISMKMVAKVAAAFWMSSIAGTLLGTNVNDGMTSVAMQQGGLGLILTTLIISTPPMAAMFFQGTVGQFAAYNSMGAFAGAGAANSAMRPGPGGQMVPAAGGYVNQAPAGRSPSGMANADNSSQNTQQDFLAQMNRARSGSASPQTENCLLYTSPSPRD